MESEDLSTLRTELLRQKVVFAAELRRQRDEFEERLEGIAQALAERDADCRNLQAMVTILGKKLDLFSKQFSEQKTRATPLRRTVSNRRPSTSFNPENSSTSIALAQGGQKSRGGALSPDKEPRRSHTLRRNPSSLNPPDLLRLNLMSSLKSLSRSSSPFNEFHSRNEHAAAVVSARGVNQHRPLSLTPTKSSSACSEANRQTDKKELGGSESYCIPTRSSTCRKAGSLSLRSSKGSIKP